MTHAEKLLAALDDRLSGTVELTPDWMSKRLPIPGRWNRLRLYRLGNEDLFLSKLMRDDPIDRMDALVIVKSAPLTPDQIRNAIQKARIPAIPEIAEQFERCARPFFSGAPA